MKIFYSSVFLLLILFGCSDIPDTPYIKSIKDFHSKRIEKLKQPNSWLSLVGLYWLKEGENNFGTDKSNDVVFPKGKAPEFIGKFILKDSIVTVNINDNVEVTYNDTLIKSLQLKNDLSEEPTILKLGSLSWYVIKRGNRYGIRLKDSNSKLLEEFEDIDMFDIDPKWKVKAEFIEYEQPKEVEIPTAIGTVEKETVYGKLKFSINKEEFTFEPLGDRDGLFLVFGDMTNGEETYGAGRFLSVDKPDSTGKIFIDFNKTYNPPCAFTKYATCPIPTKENYLKTKIIAGEKNFHSAYH
ncbi:MAG: DUF1684 domain-containing protein [Bacteroidota bacterium]